MGQVIRPFWISSAGGEEVRKQRSSPMAIKYLFRNAAMMNSIMTRSFDFEVTGPEPEGANAGKMVGHVASTTEPAALSIAEYTGATGKEMIAAVVLGGDLAARIAVANDFSFDTSFEVCGTANAFGAAAIAGRLMHLDHAQMVNAFGILLNLLAGSFQGIWDGVHSFKLPGAMSAYQRDSFCPVIAEGIPGYQRSPYESSRLL